MAGGQFRRWCGEVTADRRDGVGDRKQWCPGQEVVGGRGQSVLVGAPIKDVAIELLRRGVRHCSQRHVRRGHPGGVSQLAGDAEITEEHPGVPAGVRRADENVRRFDVAMQQSLTVGVVQGGGHRGDDRDHRGGRHPSGILARQLAGGVLAVDVGHRNPQLPARLAAVPHLDDMGMPQPGGQVGFPSEPLPVVGVMR